jgi:peptidoglycan/xylan/chitin deacetylase (PgdA/CDA1 family)/glycosyltransferase involved in cell wall biosynthesis
MKISIVIPTFNRREMLARTLPHLLHQDFPEKDYEVIVAVDGSTDNTVDMLRSIVAPCRLKVVEQRHSGPATARNNAVHAASGALLLFIDDDLVCGKSLVREHVAAHCGPQYRVSHGPIFVSAKSPRTLAGLARARSFESRHLHFVQDPSGQIGLYTQINFCIPRELFLTLGSFDSWFNVSEDTELGVRLLKRGIDCIYLPAAGVEEIYSKSTRRFLECDVREYGAAEIHLCLKHPDHRPSSEFRNFGASTIPRRIARELACRFPISLWALVGPPLWFLESLLSIGACQRTGVFLFDLYKRLAFLRGAVAEVGSLTNLKRQYEMRLPVLLYHNVGPARSARYAELTISPKRFRSQMRWLSARGYTTIRSRDWVEWVTRGMPLPRKPVLLTFDDGYADLATYAFPVLRRLGLGAEVFVVTGRLGGTNAWDHEGQPGTHPLLTAADIKTWSVDGIHFQSHSRTHANLTASDENLAEEIAQSAEDITRITGETAESFAYPFGYYNDAAKSRARSAYRCAYTAEPGLNELSVDLFELKRVLIPHDRSLLDFACRVAFGWSPIEKIRSVLRIRSRARSAMRLIGVRA